MIHDPAVGVRRYRLDELNLHFTGIAIEVSPKKEFVSKPSAPRLRLAQLFKPGPGFAKTSVQLLLLSLLIQVLGILSPLYMQLVIDQGLSRQDHDLILLLALLFLLVALGKTIISHFRGMLALQFSNQFGFQFARGTFEHLIRLPLGFFERRAMGDIVSRFSATDNITQLITHEMISVIVDGLFSIITLVLLYLYSPRLALVALLFLSLYVLCRLLSLHPEKLLRQEVLVTGAHQQSLFMESVKAISVLKLNGVEQQRSEDWLAAYTEQVNSGFRLGQFQLGMTSLQALIFSADHIVTVYLGAALVFEQSLSLGQLMSFIFLKQQFSSAVTAMVPKFAELRLMGLELERLADIGLEPVEQDIPRNALLPIRCAGELQVDSVSFRYHESEAYVLQDISFQLPMGESLVIWGKSGSGKSTLLRLLLNLDKPTQGVVLLDNNPVQSFCNRDFRNQVAAVMHGDDLLAGSLAYNIHLDWESFDEAKLAKLCRLVGLEDVVSALPMGLSTPIGELGSIFSAGQKQRILLARALYRQPKLLILDEALSHIGDEDAVRIVRDLTEMKTFASVSHAQSSAI